MNGIQPKTDYQRKHLPAIAARGYVLGTLRTYAGETYVAKHRETGDRFTHESINGLIHLVYKNG